MKHNMGDLEEEIVWTHNLDTSYFTSWVAHKVSAVNDISGKILSYYVET